MSQVSNQLESDILLKNCIGSPFETNPLWAFKVSQLAESNLISILPTSLWVKYPLKLQQCNRLVHGTYRAVHAELNIPHWPCTEWWRHVQRALDLNQEHTGQHRRISEFLFETFSIYFSFGFHQNSVAVKEKQKRDLHSWGQAHLRLICTNFILWQT